MSQIKKDRVPPPLQKLLDIDIYCTKHFVLWANQFLPLRQLRVHYKALEITCHGIPWFAFWIAFTWLFDNPSLVQMQVNMLLGLFIDIFMIAMIKAYTRRRRPVANTDDALGQLGPDKFSFPSGHASRAVFVAYFFINLYPVSIFFYPPLLAWATSICLSRLLLNRHHILDVTAGVLLGLFIGWFVGVLWIEESTAMWLINYLSDERRDGGEFHV